MQTTIEASESEVVVEMKTGVKVVQTTNKTLIREDASVKKVMEAVEMEESRIEEVVSVSIKSAERTVETVISVREESGLKTVVGVVDVESGEVKFVGEREFAFPWDECEKKENEDEEPREESVREVCEKYLNHEIIETEELLQTTVISDQIYQQVLTQNTKLQQVRDQLVRDYPILEDAVPSDTRIEVVGDKTLFTLAFSEEQLLLQYCWDGETGESELVSENLIPGEIVPLLLETETTRNGTQIIRSNSVS